MRILMVSPFPPLRDGVGRYAAQEVRALRDQGHEVDVLAPVPCAAHLVENMKGGLRLLRLRRHARTYDRVVLQYQPSHYHTRGKGPRRFASNIGMALTFRSVPNLTVVCHEIEYPPAHWRRWRPELFAERLAWSWAPEVAFHTTREAELMRERIGAHPRRVVMRDHGANFTPATYDDRATARRKLGVATDRTLFLCIGFVQPQKGFDRAARAIRELPNADAMLVVAGSLKDREPPQLRFLAELESLARDDPRIDLRIGVLSDEEFDRWLIAADCVVLPYREIWSSGVIERAKLLDRPVIVTDVGGLREQARETDTLVRDDAELVRAMARVAGAAPRPHHVTTASDAAQLVRAEASRRRGRPFETGDSATASPSQDLLAQLGNARGVRPVVLPSPRRIVGPAFTRAKHVLRRAFGWYVVPMVGQINVFHDRTVEAVSEVASRLDHLVADLGRLRAALESHADEHEARDPEASERASRLSEGLSAVVEQVDGIVGRVGQVERRTRGLAEAVEAGGAGEPQAAETPAAAVTSDPSAYTALDYHRFESRYRGDPEVIRSVQRDRYLKDLAGHGPVVDVGCGRGELLEVLRDAGVAASGVDVDLDMVMDCRSRGLQVEHGDGIAYLESLEPGSLGGVVALQVVEHLPPRGIIALLAAARRGLRPDGVLVCETINPGSLYALANWYTMDLTHSQPVHPNSLAFLVEQEGFRDVEVRYLSPVREEGPPAVPDESAPPWARVLADELRRLDEVVFGPQDYALVARRA